MRVPLTLLAVAFGLWLGPTMGSTPSDPPLVQANLTIGEIEGNDDAYLLGLVTGVSGDGQGRVVIADMQLARVQVFDSTGGHLQTIGRRGEGPGEMQRPASLAFLGDGLTALYDLDFNAYLWFDEEGRPLARRIKTQRAHAFDWIKGDGAGSILHSLRDPDLQDGSFPVARVTLYADGRVMTDSVLVRSIPTPVVSMSAPEVAFMSGFVPIPMAPATAWTGLGDSVVFSSDGSYLVERVRFSGGADTLFQGPVGTRVRIPDWVREQFLADRKAVLERNARRAGIDPGVWLGKMVMPDRFPDVIRMMTDPFGRLWILSGAPSGKPKLDLWTRAGDLIGSMVLDVDHWPDLDPMAVSGTHVLCLFENELGVHQIRGFPIPASMRAEQV